MPGLASLFMLDQTPATDPIYVGAAADPGTGIPAVAPDARDDYMAGTPGQSVFTTSPGIPNKLDLQSTGKQSVDGNPDSDFGNYAVSGLIGMPTSSWEQPYTDNTKVYAIPVQNPPGVWYDTPRPNAGYPLPVPADNGTYSTMEQSNDFAALQANKDFPIDAYTRFGQPNNNPDDRRITERTFDTPVPWKANPTFPAQIQEPRPWDRALGAWPWTGTKAAISQPVTSLPNYYPTPLVNGVPSPGGAARATIPNTQALTPQPMTFRIMPQQWDTDYVYSGQ